MSCLESNAARRLPRILLAALAVALTAGRAPAINGVNAIQFTPQAGWKGFELVTQGDYIGAIADSGYGTTATRGLYDGIGALAHDGLVTVFFNNEQTQSAVSRVDVDQVKLQQAVRSRVDGGATPFPAGFVTSMGYAYQAVYDGAYHAVNYPAPVASGTSAVGTYGNANFSRFCSSQLHLANAFGPDHGFADPIYITGEEVTGGKFYALDLTTRAFWEAPALGLGSWENAAQVDTGNTTHVALVMMSDLGSSPGDYIRLYVGAKGVDANGDGTVDFLERNGLRGGTVYYFDPVGAAGQTLPDGSMTGAWSASTAEALRDTKLEDVDTNPLNGAQAVFAATNDGVYKMELNMNFNATSGAFDPAASTTTLTQLVNDNGALAEPDNLDWSRNGKIYMQEDGAGNEMFEMNADGTGFLKIGAGLSEPSGIVDASQLVGYQPGSVFLSSFQGTGTTGAQLTVMISPYAAPLAASPDFDFDGDVDGADFLAWQRGFGTGSGAVSSQGDADGDQAVNGGDLELWTSQFGSSATAALIPEPGGGTLALFGMLALRSSPACARRRK